MPGDDASDTAQLAKLEASANGTAAHVRNVFFFFLTYGLYLAVTVGATTHEQLLREAPVQLPILNVAIPLFGFYWVAPALFVLLHFNLMLQFYLLSRKLRELERALEPLSAEERAAHLSGLDTFAFSHMLIGRHHSWLFRTLFRLIVWITVIILPVVLLLGVQVRFLPYHDAATTMFHRSMVALDLALLWIIWRRVVTRDDSRTLFRRTARWARGTTLAAVTLLVGLSSLFLFTFPGDLDDPEIGDPMEEMLITWLQPIEEGLVNPHPTGNGNLPTRQGQIGMWAVQPPPWAAEPVPDGAVVERAGDGPPQYLLDRGRPSGGVSGRADEGLLPARPPGFRPTLQVFERFPAFLSRNLRVAETNLVTAWPSEEQIQEFGEAGAWRNFGRTVDLRGRDLRYGDFSESTVVHAELDGADLRGAVFEGTNLQGADLRDVKAQESIFFTANLRAAKLRGSDFQGADLMEADLEGAELWNVNLKWTRLDDASLPGIQLYGENLQGASLSRADLQDAVLRAALFQGANLYGAQLQGVYLTLAKLHGASFSRADLRGASLAAAELQGADLSRADLQGANLEDANLQGANLAEANLQGAVLTNAMLDGADMSSTDLRGADLSGASVQGAILNGASLWGATLPENPDPYWLSELRDLDVTPPLSNDLEQRIETAKAEIRSEKALARVIATLEELRERLSNDDWNDDFPPKLWHQSNVLLDSGSALDHTDFDHDLANFLIELACGTSTPPSLARRIGVRAFTEWREGKNERLYPALVAERLLDMERCPPAKALSPGFLNSLEAIRQTHW